MFFETKVWTTKQLADDLRAAGFKSGDNVIMHSSLKSVGRTENGPSTVIDAVTKVLGAKGNLLVPTFTYSLPGWRGDPFDYESSPARTGIIPETVRKDPRSTRSFHPTHSVAVIGSDAEELTENHLQYTPLGVGSPFSRMLDRNGKILMLGTHQDTNSSLHLCEVLAGLPYINTCFSDNTDFEVAWYQNPEGQVEFVPVREVPGCSRGFRQIEPFLIKMGVLQTVRIGGASAQLLVMKDLVEAAKIILDEHPTLLLCKLPHCGICPKRRKVMEELKAPGGGGHG